MRVFDIGSENGILVFKNPPNYETSRRVIAFQCLQVMVEFEERQVILININDVNDAPASLDEWRDENLKIKS